MVSRSESPLGSCSASWRLDHAERGPRGELATHARELEEDDIAELRLREVGDADGGVLAIDRDPLVRPGVATVSHGDSPSSRCVSGPSHDRKAASPLPPG